MSVSYYTSLGFELNYPLQEIGKTIGDCLIFDKQTITIVKDFKL